MARARLIKPSFFTNDDLAELPMAARLLFAGLWTIADREGRLEDRPKRIKAEVMPFDNVNVDRLLDDLAGRGFIARYESENLRLIQVVAFSRHQSPHPKEPASRLPVMGEPMTSNRPDSGSPVAKQEPIHSARGTLADPVLPIPMAGSALAVAENTTAAAENEPTKIRDVIDAWTNATGQTVTALTADAMEHWIEKAGVQWVLDAITETGLSQVRNWKYTAAILERWVRDGRDWPPDEREIEPLATNGHMTSEELEAAGFRKRYKVHAVGGAE